MKTMQERIALIISEMEGPERGKQSRLARLAGCTRGLVNQWLSGTNETTDFIYAKNIEQELGYRAEWVMRGTPPLRRIDSESKIKLPISTTSSLEGEIVINQFETGGSMGLGVLLRDQPGAIHVWTVTKEWVQKNVRSHTGVSNLAIVTGFGDSMRGMFNPGDPLLVDRGVTSVDADAVYFFRVGEEGFIKRLQRIPGEGIRVKSVNPDYDTWTIKPEMDFEVFARVVKVWCGTDF